jgi:DNA modification methylase
MSKRTAKPSAPSALEHWPTSKPIPYARNARKIDARAVSAVAGSIKEFGFKSPILVDAEGVIIAGHTRLQAAQSLGLESVPVIVCRDLSPDQVKAYRLADNRVAEFSEWDAELLKLELGDIDMEMDFAGFDELIAEFGEGEAETMDEGDPDAVPAEVAGEPISQRGEVYELGPHRLMCGDSTSAEDWQAILGDEIADAVMTDPPYGVEYVGGDKCFSRTSFNSGDKVENDESDPVKLRALLDASLGIMFSKCKLGGSIYMAHADTAGVAFRDAMTGAGFKLAACIIWAKSAFVFGRSDYKWQHEPILYGWKEGAAHTWHGPANESTLWDYRRPSPSSKEHPTMKPVELYERMMTNSTAPGEMVLEPFGGSGTTLIAAAKTGRICRAMEIAPRYCDVIRKRWTKFAKENGKDPGSGALE